MVKKKDTITPRKSTAGFDYAYVDWKIDEAKKEIREDISHLPTREEFYSKMDEVMGELKKIRETNEILTPRTYDLVERVEAIEKIHPKGKHSIQN